MAGKIKTVFICSECGAEAPKWVGKCPKCNNWNTMQEEVISPAKTSTVSVSRSVTAKPINEITVFNEHRFKTNIPELDRVLGGGLVKGSVSLISGDPGIGKSTILLQICKNIDSNLKLLYVSGEESAVQIKLRANRLGVNGNNVCVMAETDVQAICNYISDTKPDIVMIDSIQTMKIEELSSSYGSIVQVRESANMFLGVGKNLDIPIIIVGHVNKGGEIAGPKVLEHIVDTVLYFEGERNQSYRILRAVKNRFGSTNEIGVFEMTDKGLKDVPNPSLMLLSGRPVDAPGSAIVCSVEGTRPILAEIQALVSKSSFAMPRRMATGVDFNRVSLIMTVLEKRMGLHLGDQDAYVNVTGGIKLDESATDLAIACAIASSFRNQPLPSDMAFFGEIGLTGEIRTVTQAARRIAEIQKMGFRRCMLPFDCLGSIDKCDGIELLAVRSLSDALQYIKE